MVKDHRTEYEVAILNLFSMATGRLFEAYLRMNK
jgi:hypothetical protein